MTITKLTSKIKKQKDTVSNIDYLFRLLTHFKIKTNFKFQISKLSNVFSQNKGQRKKNRETKVICFLRGQFLDSKAKTRGIALNIYEVL